jgi:hypothetical protein
MITSVTDVDAIARAYRNRHVTILIPKGRHCRALPPYTRGFLCAPRRGEEDAAGGPFTQENCQHAPLIRRHVRQSGCCFDHHGHLPLVRASPKENGEEKPRPRALNAMPPTPTP